MSSTEILFLEILKSNSIDKKNNPSYFIDDSNELLNTHQVIKEDFKIGVMKFFSNNSSEYQISVHITKDKSTHFLKQSGILDAKSTFLPKCYSNGKLFRTPFYSHLAISTNTSKYYNAEIAQGNTKYSIS